MNWPRSAICFAIALWACSEKSAVVSAPELIEVSQDQLTIAWEGQANAIEYWPLGKTDAVAFVSDEADTQTHEVQIKGLEPGKYYSYRIQGEEKTYNVQTEPLASSTISFVLFDSIAENDLLRHLISNSPGFIVSLSPLPSESVEGLRSFVTVYDPEGNTAKYLRRQPGFSGKSGYRVEWGCLVLVVSDDPAYLQKQIESLSPGYTLGILTTEKSAGALDFQPLEKHLSASSTMPGFVLLRDSDKTNEVEAIRFVGVDEPHTLYNVLVDPEFSSMTEVASGIQTELRPAPISTKRTCAECRKLAEKGAYRESIAAYIKFIESHRDHHLVDDAYFEVANIYDEKLFDFSQAMRWYEELVRTYPSSGLAPFAKERLKYLKGFDSAELPALQVFEKIRRVSYGGANEATQIELIEKVLRMSEEERDSKLSPVMLYWVGNQLRQKDAQRAVAIYRNLAAEYPDNPRAKDAVYAAAETLYESRDYLQARELYLAALDATPDKEQSILAQIDRCDRNIRRRFLVWPAAIIVCALLAASIVFRRGQMLRRWKKSVVVFTGLFLLLATWAWTIREQFPSDTVLASLTLGSALIGGVSSSLVAPLGEKTTMRAVRLIVTGLLVSLFSLSGLYLLIWITYEHYLMLFGL